MRGVNRGRPIDRATADRIVSGGHVPAGRFGAVLAAAARPATLAELTREDTVVAAFRARPPSPPAPPSAVRHRDWPPLLRVNTRMAVATAVVGAVLGGATVAAASGALAGFLPGPGSPRPGHGPLAVPPGSPGVTPAGSTAPSAAPSTPPVADGQLRGLCHAYQEAVAAGRTPSPDNPAFDRLRAAAGGDRNVLTFCQALLTTPDPRPSGTPVRSHAPHPSARPHPSAPPHPSPAPHPSPTPHPGSQPSGAPSARSTAAPTSHDVHP